MQDMQRDTRKLHIGEHPNSVSLPLSVTPRTPTGDPLPPNILVTQPPCSLSCHGMAWHAPLDCIAVSLLTNMPHIMPSLLFLFLSQTPNHERISFQQPYLHPIL